MAILETIFCEIFGVISTFLEKVVGEKFTNCIDFNDNMHTLEEKLKALTSKASDIEAKVKEVEVLGKKNRTTEVGNWLENVAKLKKDFDEMHEPGFCKPLMRGSHVKKLIESVEDLTKQCQEFSELVIDGSETSGVRSFTRRVDGEPLKEDRDKMLAWLAEESGQVPRIGIHGMGGVGKTTLAEYVCKDFQDKSGDVHVYRLVVSQDVNIEKLQEDLAKQLNLNLSKNDDVQDKADILKQKLMENLKKNVHVLLLLDDVWKDFDLREIGIPLKADRCKVIITSRSLDVCNKMGCDKYVVKVKPLPDEEAWKLFLKKLGCAPKLSPDVEGVAKIMVNKWCDGLPLAINALAGSMIGKDKIYQWNDALKELEQSSIEQNDVKSKIFRVLKTSYNRLTDSRWQQCFLYCSLYPEDYEIPRDDLITQLIYERDIIQRDSRAAKFDQGHTILDELINVCLLESVIVKKYWKEEECVKMHDLLREVAVEITKNNPKYMTKAGRQLHKLPGDHEWEEHLEKVSLMRNSIFEIPEGSSPRCPQLSTLILSSNPLKLIPDSFFDHMHGLRVLNLKYTNIKKLPDSISKLENLTALLLGDCHELCHVPSLEKLKALLVLDMSSTKIEQVPHGMKSLVKLRCLNMERTGKLMEFPTRLLPELSNLQRLLLPTRIKIQVEEVEKLEKLEEFKGWVNDVFNFKWLKEKSPPLNFYNIKAGDDAISKIRCYILHGDDAIHLQKCKGSSDCLLDTIPSSMYPKRCVIEGCDKIESILRISTNSTSNDERALQNLETLSLNGLKNFVGWFKWEPRALTTIPPRGIFSSLKRLHVVECHKMKKVFPDKLVVHNLQNLEEVEVLNCDQMEEIIADEGVCVGSTSDVNIIAFPKLKMINLQELPELDNICKGEIIRCDSIEKIWICSCPKIKRLPLYLPLNDGQPSHPPKLEKIYIEKERWESLEWDHPNSDVLRPFLNLF